MYLSFESMIQWSKVSAQCEEESIRYFSLESHVPQSYIQIWIQYLCWAQGKSFCVGLQCVVYPILWKPGTRDASVTTGTAGTSTWLLKHTLVFLVHRMWSVRGKVGMKLERIRELRETKTCLAPHEKFSHKLFLQITPDPEPYKKCGYPTQINSAFDVNIACVYC